MRRSPARPKRPLSFSQRRRRWTAQALEVLERRDLLSANVLGYHNDLGSTGVNNQETVLTPANVNSATFGKLSSTPVDGQVYAQPLYLEGVNIPAGPAAGTHNVVYVATEHDGVYAIDSANGSVLWQRSFIDPANGITTVPAQDTGSGALTPEMGITATPVIDTSTQALYVLANTKEIRADGTHYVYRLHALDLATGAEKLGGPLTIADTIFDGANFTYVSGPAVNGTGAGSVNGQITFNALREFSRVGLSDVDGNIYMAFGSHPDVNPAHGWVLAVNAQTLNLWAAVNLTPNGELGDIWQAGNEVLNDGNGQFFVSTGNGTFDTTLDANGFPVNADYGDSLVKLVYDGSTPANPNANGWGLKVVDYFSPANTDLLEDQDLDLGSGGTVLLPDAAGNAANPHLLVQAGKQGRIYLMNRDNMAGFNAAGDQTLQEVDGLVTSVFSTPAYFNGTLYYAAVNDHAKAIPLTDGKLAAAPSSQSSDTFGYPGATPSISADGAANGIVWMIDNGSHELRAYDAGNLAHELYNSDQAAGGRDKLASTVKFSVPTVADGHVFVATAGSLDIYGLLSDPPPATGTQGYVAAAFLDILGRPVDSGALAQWTNQLNHGLPRSVFTGALAHSDEYYHRVIEAAYQKYLGRVADPQGLNAWTIAMRGGLSDEQLEAAFIGSPEFYAHAGGTDRAWVDTMYQDLLGRQPDAAGEAFWVQSLALGVTRQAVAYGFAASVEREGQRIEADYFSFLGRSASPAEVSSWVIAFEHGYSNEDVIAGFAASDEYYHRRAGG